MSENVNFHMTFPPTPAYIGRLLKIADGRVRTVAEIAEETGIPEGASSGKVRPHIQYASYMWLLNSSDFTRTPLGKIVYLEDCMLTEKLTQMLCHVNMISPTGAPMWRYLFHELFPENQGHISNGLIGSIILHKIYSTRVNQLNNLDKQWKKKYLEQNFPRLTVEQLKNWKEEVVRMPGYLTSETIAQIESTAATVNALLIRKKVDYIVSLINDLNAEERKELLKSLSQN